MFYNLNMQWERRLILRISYKTYSESSDAYGWMEGIKIEKKKGTHLENPLNSGQLKTMTEIIQVKGRLIQETLIFTMLYWLEWYCRVKEEDKMKQGETFKEMQVNENWQFFSRMSSKLHVSCNKSLAICRRSWTMMNRSSCHIVRP